MNAALPVMVLLSALGCGLIAGVFFAFSVFVMKALALQPPAQGLAAMQSVNVTVIHPLFLGTFLGSGVLGLAAAGFLLASPVPAPGTWAVAAGAVLYLGGTIGVTMVCNVPRNNALARVDPASPPAPGLWQEYVRSWTRWNHVRTMAALAAAAFLTTGYARLSASAEPGAIPVENPSGSASR